MKTIRIVTLLVPLATLTSGCQLLEAVDPPAATGEPAVMRNPGDAARPPIAEPSASGAMQLKSATALAAESQFERDDVKAESRFGDADFHREQARGLGGDAESAMRVARMYGDGSNGVPRSERSMVLWLKHASMLDHGAASYQLYLYYLARGLDRDAVRYERRAVQQGYVLPVRLDNRRG